MLFYLFNYLNHISLAPMEEMLQRMILRLLKNTGFETAESRALAVLVKTFDDRISSFLRTVSQLSVLGGRPSVCMLDLFGTKQATQSLARYRPLPTEILVECGSTVPKCRNGNTRNLFSLIPLLPEIYPRETVEDEEEWVSPLSTRVEKFIHIYEFMPNFPPIHTFRTTAVKNHNSKNQSSKVKNRLEQSLRSEGNMIKLIKSSGSIPNFINYIYKNK